MLGRLLIMLDSLREDIMLSNVVDSEGRGRLWCKVLECLIWLVLVIEPSMLT